MPFGDPRDERERISEDERAQQIIDIIVETVEPDAWDIMGGDWATIRYYQRTLIVRAPDFVHRQLGGYPYPTRPLGAASVDPAHRRFVSFGPGLSDIRYADGRPLDEKLERESAAPLPRKPAPENDPK